MNKKNIILKRKLKYGFFIIGITMVSIAVFIGCGLYAMEIEDHYGDLQEFFYLSKNGDLIINKTTSDFGIVEKGWTRVQIVKPNQEAFDLYNWTYQNSTKTEIILYRPSKKLNLEEITFKQLTDLIKKKELKLITRN